MFKLDPAFRATSEALASLALCEARLQLDARYAWILLVPRIEAAVELEDLSSEARVALTDEIVQAGRAVRAIAAAVGRPAEKLNVGQLGNVTRQLHVHVVGRRSDDPAWPGPVWGRGAPEPYDPAALAAAKAAALAALSASAA